MTFLRRGVAGAAVGLALGVAVAPVATASPVGQAHRTVTTASGTFHLSLLAGPTGVSVGGTVRIGGAGYNADQGIYLGFCAIPEGVQVGKPETYTVPPGPCLPGAAHRVTSAGGGTPGVTIPYGPGGSFVTTLTVRPEIADGVVCDVTVHCAVVTHSDFTAFADRNYDQYIPLHF
jgi:hypothetical protein